MTDQVSKDGSRQISSSRWTGRLAGSNDTFKI